nr:L434 [uncultured bacterium]
MFGFRIGHVGHGAYPWSRGTGHVARPSWASLRPTDGRLHPCGRSAAEDGGRAAILVRDGKARMRRRKIAA